MLQLKTTNMPSLLAVRSVLRASRLPTLFSGSRRVFSSNSPAIFDYPRRSYLYVPCSSDRMLEKSVKVGSDVIIYDLEDSVSPSPEVKASARDKLRQFLGSKVPESRGRAAVRVNAVHTPYFREDMALLKHQQLGALVMPKINSAEDLHEVSEQLRLHTSNEDPVYLVASIESAKAMFNIGEIAFWKSQHGASGGKLFALLFAAEDYCADASVQRTASRTELLYARSHVVTAAKAFGLEAIDMVCVNYQDQEYLIDECKDGRNLGFDGKQAIHPSQVSAIQKTFMPTDQEVERARKIISQMSSAHSTNTGAFGLECATGGKEMIDAPMLKQALRVMNSMKKAANA